MKLFAICLMFISLAQGCDETESKTVQDKTVQSKEVKSMEVLYTANSRGFHQRILIKDQMMYIANSRDEKDDGPSTRLTDAQWKSLVSEMGKINPEILPTLKAPTEKRFYDGAAIANLKVTYKGKEYMTTDFDHGYPPAEIEKVVNMITALAK